MKATKKHEEKIRQVKKNFMKKKERIEFKKVEECKKIEILGGKKKLNNLRAANEKMRAGYALLDKELAQELMELNKNWRHYLSSRKDGGGGGGGGSSHSNQNKKQHKKQPKKEHTKTVFRSPFQSEQVIVGGAWPFNIKKRTEYNDQRHVKPVPRKRAACFAWGGRVFLHGGILQDGKVSRVIWSMVPRTGQWSSTRPTCSEGVEKTTKWHGHTATVLSTTTCLLIGPYKSCLLRKVRRRRVKGGRNKSGSGSSSSLLGLDMIRPEYVTSRQLGDRMDHTATRIHERFVVVVVVVVAAFIYFFFVAYLLFFENDFSLTNC